MWLQVITCLLVACAAVFNAVCDRLENAPAFDGSIFWNKNQKFWRKDVSWQHAKRLFRFDFHLFGLHLKNSGYKLDMWHFSKSAWVCLLLFAVWLNAVEWLQEGYTPHLFLFLGYGLVWNITFTQFHDRFLKRKL